MSMDDYQLSMFTVLLEFEESRTLVNIPDAWSPPENFLEILEEKLKKIGVEVCLTFDYSRSA